MSYLAVECVIPEGREDELAAGLSEITTLGALIGEQDRGGVPVTVYLAQGDAAMAAGLRAVIVGLGGFSAPPQSMPDADWLAHYRRAVRPFAVGGRWWLDPHPECPTSAPQGRVRLAIEPRTAFGSGSHESTRLVLLELERAPPEGLAVLDVGTGSAILALASERLGARRVVGLDIDLGAVFVARQVAAQQEWRSRAELFAGPVAAVGRATFELILCNMIWEHSRPLLDELRAVLGKPGAIVLSGLLAAERAAIRSELAGHGLAVERECQLAEWLCLRVGHG